MGSLLSLVYRIFARILTLVARVLSSSLGAFPAHLHLASAPGDSHSGTRHPPAVAPDNTDSSSSICQTNMSRDVVENGSAVEKPISTACANPRPISQSQHPRDNGEGSEDSSHQRQVDRFSQLPDKLLLLIFEMVHSEARHDLCSVSLANNKLHALADKILYKALLFDNPEQHLTFSESLDRRPRRGSMIQDVVLAYPTSELSHLILDAPLDRSHYDPDRIDGLSRSLSTMSYLRTLDIAVPVKLLPGIGALFNGPFDLAELRECSLYFQSPDNAYWDLQETIHIFTHPELERLTLKRARLDERGFDSLERPHSTGLKVLSFVECDINDDALADIMEFPAGLREFHMCHTADPQPELEESSDEINEFVMALKPCAETLETIVIDHPTLGGRKVLRMRDFVAIKTLRMNFDTQLFGKTGRKPRLHSVGLPPELETLEFFSECGNDETVTELFATALENSSYMARNLRALIMAEGPKGLPQQIVDACKGKKFQLLTKRLGDEDEDEN